MTRTFLRFSLIASMLAALASPAFAQLHEVALLKGKEHGPTAALLYPARKFENTHTAAHQIAAWQIQTGQLRVLTYDAPTTDSVHLRTALDAFTDKPEIVIAIGLDLPRSEDSGKARLPELTAPNIRIAERAISAALSASVHQNEIESALRVRRGTDPGVYTLHFSEPNTTRSRIDRWTRLFTAELLSEFEMQPTAESLALSISRGELSFALYDCEGVGGSGPRMLETIISNQPIGATVTYVCPEDIREGVLSQFDGVLFPGGSGRGIATALGEEGQEAVRAFVQAGGGYVGICAGAYLATCRIEGYLNMAGAYHNQPWRKGGGPVDIELTPEGEAIFGSDFRTFVTRYNNGPVFGHEDGLTPEGDFEPIQVLAYFRSATTNPVSGQESTEMIDQAAITATEFGAGRLLMISPHPETHRELDPMMARGLLWSVKRLNVESKATDG